ncbi:MAG: hypothetical protein ACUVQG_14450, partial [Thermogutta sp.]
SARCFLRDYIHRQLTPAAQNAGGSERSQRERARKVQISKPETNSVINSAGGYWPKTTSPQQSLLSILTSQLKTR